MFRRLLVPVDGSEGSLRAARVAGEIARKFESQVTLLHVVHVTEGMIASAGMAGMIGPDWAESQAAEQAAREILDAAAKAIELPAQRVTQEVLRGHPAATICQAAENGAYDLIVMGSRGLSEVGAFFLGSVSDKVSHHAHCPVMIVR